MSDVLPSKTNSFECQSKFVKHTFDFCWSIEEFPKHPSTFSVTSPKFHPIKEMSFYATVEAISTDCSYNNLEIAFVKEWGAAVEVSHKMAITDGKGSECTSDSTTYKYPSGCSLHKRSYSGSHFADHSILIFKCKMEFKVPSTDIVPKYSMPSLSANASDLVDDLRTMYTNSSYADLSLKVEENFTLSAHKGILCSRSPVFSKMLQSPMDEKEEDVISIEDIELPIVEGLMEFLYTGVLCDDDFDFVYDLYYAADKYDVSSLRKMCTDVLLAKLDVENACRVLCLADRHSNVLFKDAVMEFIQFHFDDIVETDSWAEFLDEETKLAAEVMRSRSQKNKK